MSNFERVSFFIPQALYDNGAKYQHRIEIYARYSEKEIN